MKSRSSSNASMYVCKFQRAIVASAIAVFLGACAGGTEEGAANGNATETTPALGAAVDTDTDLVVTGSGSDVEVTPEVDSTDIDTVVDESEGVQTDVEGEVDSTIDVSEGVQTDVEGEVDQTTDTVNNPEVDSTDSIPDNALGLIQAHPELGLFATAIQSSGLAIYLADPEQQVTVFALSDKAFESLSAIQRDALFNDSDRLDTLVRATTIPERRITESAAGIVDDMQTLSNGTLTFEREGDVISVATSDYYSTVAVEVTSTVVGDKVAIHIIDDFINISATFFPPDPGSIMESLLADDASMFSVYISRTRWYRELGNSEGEWTVFVPSVFSTSDIEPYIVAHIANGPMIIEAGTLLTSVDGSSHVIENVDGALTFDNQEILELNALQVNNGHVHRLAWVTTPGVGGSVYDMLVQSTEHTFLVAAIDAAGLASTLDGADAVFTVFAPNDDAFTAYNDAVAAGLATADDDTDDLPALGDLSEAQVSRILLNHVVSGSVETPEDGAVLSTLAAADATVDPALVAQTLTVSIDVVGNTSVAAIGGDPVLVLATLVGTEADAVEQDIVHSVGAILVPSDLTADEVDSGGDEPVTGTGGAALIGSDTTYSEAGAAFIANFPDSLDNTNGNVDTFMFFVTSNAAMAAIPLTGADLTLPNVIRHIQTTVTALVDGGTITTVGDEGASHAVAADADVEGGFTVGGFPVTLLGTTPEGGEIYGIEGILP